MDDALSLAREKVNDVTPLKRDCGRICGRRCCRSLEGEETGMLLFPGEEAQYQGKAGWEIRNTEAGPMVICPGTCDRNERPLACRLFPLIPVLRDGKIRAVVDRRAGTVCPLAGQGIRAVDPAFITAVREAGEILITDERQRRFLAEAAAEQEELKRLREELGGSHVYSGKR